MSAPPTSRQPVRDLGAVLDQVSKAVLAAAAHCLPEVDQTVVYLPAVAGKGVRPRMAILAAAAVSPDAPPPVELAAGIELLHLATLHHDDVADQAPLRRGQPTIAALRGNRAATFAGTYLFARGTELVARAGEPFARAAAACTAALWRGQTNELVSAYRTDRTEAQYLDVISDKTGSLIGLACFGGAVAAGMSVTDAAGWDRFGKLWGSAFQLADDIADITSSTTRLGKEAGTDVREGVYTLPVILTLEAGGDRARELRALLGRPGLSAEEAIQAGFLILDGPGLAGARATLVRLTDAAHDGLAALPPSWSRDLLHTMVDDVWLRVAQHAA